MAKKRDEDGNIQDVPTHVPSSKESVSSDGAVSLFGDDTPTRPPAGRARPSRGGESLYDGISNDETRPAGSARKKRGVQENQADPSEPATQVFGRHSAPKSTTEPLQQDVPETYKPRGQRQQAQTETPQVDPMTDPVAGWLVVVEGPGQGHFLKIGYGQNSVGREASGNQRIVLNFDDEQISRENHATIIYEPKGKQFFIAPGTSSQLAYLVENDQQLPVMAVTQLQPLQHLVFGYTTLRFVPLCGAEFCWDDYVNND